MVIVSAFYILANIGELDSPELLGRWVGQAHDHQFPCKSLDLDAWLVSAYFNQGQAPADVARAHQQLLGEHEIARGTIARSKWNAIWETSHPMSGMSRVDVSDIPTIEVLHIPDKLPIDGETQKQVIAHFLEYTGQPAGQ